MLFSDKCQICGDNTGTPCGECILYLSKPRFIEAIPNLDSLYALFEYHGRGRDMIRSIKFNNRRACMRWLAFNLAAQFNPAEFDAVTFVPSRSINVKARGFDHTELLAKAVSRFSGLPCIEVLRNDSISNQAGLPRTRRLSNASFRSTVRSPKRLVLIDDIVTTGNTLSSAAGALRWGGAEVISGLVAAVTPSVGYQIPA